MERPSDSEGSRNCPGYRPGRLGLWSFSCSHLGPERGRDSPKVTWPGRNSLVTTAGHCPEPQEGLSFLDLSMGVARLAESQESSTPGNHLCSHPVPLPLPQVGELGLHSSV